MTCVFFIGAGPGDPELITVKGLKIIQQAEVIIYAGSLVNPDILRENKRGADVYNSAGMTLREIIDVIQKAATDNRLVARLHTGDLSIYSAAGEQMARLDQMGIRYEVIPGVSSFSAAAAAIRKELTLPGVSQTLILTRMGGRTPVPVREDLEDLACHQATMAIFLSAGMIDRVVEKLKTSYPRATPVVVIQRASWEDEQVIRGTLSDIAGKVKKAGITKTALILVGHVLATHGEDSRLYDEGFSHEYRKGEG